MKVLQEIRSLPDKEEMFVLKASKEIRSHLVSKEVHLQLIQGKYIEERKF